MAENICSEVAEPAQTSTVLSQLHPGLPGSKTKQNPCRRRKTLMYPIFKKNNRSDQKCGARAKLMLCYSSIPFVVLGVAAIVVN